MMPADDRISVVLRGVRDGKITSAEADAYLQATEHLTLAQAKAQYERPPPRITIIGLVIIAVLALGYFTTTTGLVVLNTPTGFTVLDTRAHALENVTSVRITGYLTGEGTANISLNTTSGEYHIATITSDDGSPRTEQPSYAPGAPVNVEHLPNGASVYFDDGTATTRVTLPLNASNGTLLVVTTTSTYRLPIIIGSAPRITSFAAVCDQTCTLASVTGMITTAISGNATLTITNITTTTTLPNRPPVLARAFPTIALNTTMTIDLNAYFADPDGDELLYTAGSNDAVNATITGSTLTLTPLQDANTTLLVYASDLHELVAAEIALNIIVLNATESIALTTTNEKATSTVNVTTSAINITVAQNATYNTTTIASNMTNATIASNVTCAGSNPNLLPTDCFLVNGSYYPDQDIFWESVDRAKVARFTALGNLLITGGVVEHDTSAPGARDFTIGYLDPDDAYVATIWVDGNGNLHLRGSLHEENANLAPNPGSYAVRNRRLLYLAYADTSIGDLHLRGNVIPYRRTIE